jgi:hypothetical protein
MIKDTAYRHEPVEGWIYPAIETAMAWDGGMAVCATIKMEDGSIKTVKVSVSHLIEAAEREA